MIGQLNPVIRGWTNYHRNQVSKKIYSKVDHLIWEMLWEWSVRRHPNKGRKWVKRRYFIKEGHRSWVFGTNGGSRLRKAADTPIKRHVKVKSQANPFDKEWKEYFEDRHFRLMKDELRTKKLASLWIRQKGECGACSQLLTSETGWHVHHATRRVDGGKDTLENLILLHPNCHRKHHNVAGSNQGLIKA